MSILKFANAKNRRNDALKRGVEYILNPQKTTRNLINGNGISLDSPFEDMNTVQLLLRKSTGRRYIHYIISFDLGISAETAYQVATECANYFAEDYQYILAIHTNTANVHAHVIINAVNIHTGKKFSQSKPELFKFRDYVNQCLMQHCLNPISAKTSSKLVSEEVYENGEFEVDYNSSVPKNNTCNYTFSEVKRLKAYGYNFSYFGPIDEDEFQQIHMAESHKTPLSQIIEYFQGSSPSLPQGMTLFEAEDIYTHWCETQEQVEEPANYGFFSKHSKQKN